MRKTLLGECLAEFFGTFILIFIGVGTVAAMVTAEISMSFWELSIAWGLAVSIAIYVVGAISGGHINPAVTIGLAVWGGFEKRKILPYIGSQVAGAFAGAAVVYGLYREAILIFEKANEVVRATDSGWASAGIFSTFPKSYLSTFEAFLVEMAITALLMIVIFAVTDGKNGAAPAGGLPAVAIGLTIAICGISFGPLTGFAMNPARDLGPRLFLMLSGWETNVIGPHLYGLIVPIFGPIVGAILGGGLYKKLIAPYFPVTTVDPVGKDYKKAS
ncbi:MIP/aquaporin family protein [Neobacillus niacini]|uniref:MIP/aquaporin family protein n=1 Tax=Neobacillus niacini TaxID=86668 RepID=UPI00203A8AAF|nr:MIP/aquaporin family protein [Neobacillus niacini]MCM3691885.1 aquaporin family protein [Neobacillus niacini]